MKIKKKHLNPKLLVVGIILLIIIIFVILSLTLKESRKLSPIESFFKDTLVYVEKVILYPINYISDKVESYKELKNVKKENDILESSVDRIDSIETENIELRRQIEALKKELDVNYTLTDYEYLNASVITRNVGFWYNTFTISKGSYNGVKKDMVVINKGGLVGRVVKTSTFTSEVKLITTGDTNNKISVHVSNGSYNLYGLINKYNASGNYLEVEGISNTKEVNIGDKVYTSGLGGIFPSGILIGTVSDITTDSYDLAKIIKVTPSVDFGDINYVSVLKRKSDKK